MSSGGEDAASPAPPGHRVAVRAAPFGDAVGEKTGAVTGQMASGALALMLIQDGRREARSWGRRGAAETSARAGDKHP